MLLGGVGSDEDIPALAVALADPEPVVRAEVDRALGSIGSAAAVIGAGIIAFAILVTYRYAQQIGRRIGRTGMVAVLRLSAFIMLCTGVGIS